MDVGVLDGRIVSVGDLREEPSRERLHVDGLTIIPGVIDTHVHFREPGFEHKEDLETGSRAAVLGGVTTVFEMPNTQPQTTSAEALQDKLDRANGRACCNYAFWIGATKENASRLGELESMPGTPGVKAFMAGAEGELLIPDDQTLRRVLQNGVRRVALHSEDHARLESRKLEHGEPRSAADHPFIRDAECARLATERLLRLAKETGRPVHILHLSTADEVPLIERARGEGIDVTAEVTPHHLYFQAPEAYARLGSLIQMNPPIREASHRSALWSALTRGFFDAIGSDHAPHTVAEKRRPYPASPSGMPGVQTLLPVLLTLALEERLLGLAALVSLLTEKHARLFGIEQKGLITPGYDADVAVLDPEARYVLKAPQIASKCGWSPYEGESLRGRVVHTLVAGKVVVRDGALTGDSAGNPVRFVASRSPARSE